MILYSNWLGLPIITRMKIAAKFGIPKTGSTHVVGNSIQSDGYTVQDVEKALNLQALQNYLGVVETDTTILWNKMIDKIEEKPLPQIIPPVIKKRGRPTKQK